MSDISKWTMFSDRISFSVELVAVSDLHIGKIADLSEVGEKSAILRIGEMDEPSEPRGNLAKLVRDNQNRPMVPATSLKGVLKARFEGRSCASILGSQTDVGDQRRASGTIARLWLGNASLIMASDEDLSGLGKKRPEGGVYIADHVMLDARTAAAQTNHLYQQEMIASGGRFHLTGHWFGSEAAELFDALGEIAAGVQVGKSTSKGYGLLQLQAETLSATRHVTGTDGRMIGECVSVGTLSEWRGSIATAAARNEINSDITVLNFTCDEPFMSVRDIAQDDGETKKRVRPLERGGRPALSPNALIGAMRARARWKAECARARGGLSLDRSEAISADDRKLDGALNGRRAVERLDEDLGRLSPVERIFGVTGYRARVAVRKLEATNASERVDLSSVSLDRIIGAGRNGFLFTEQVFLNTKFRVEIDTTNIADGADRAFWEDLLTDLCANGLDLGHGASKGFGWFSVEIGGDQHE